MVRTPSKKFFTLGLLSIVDLPGPRKQPWPSRLIVGVEEGDDCSPLPQTRKGRKGCVRKPGAGCEGNYPEAEDAEEGLAAEAAEEEADAEEGTSVSETAEAAVAR